MKERSDRKKGRPPLNVTEDLREEIKRLSGFGTPIRAISAIVGVSVGSLYNHYHKDLVKGRTKTNERVVRALIEAAVGGNVSAQIYWIKHHCNWKEGGDLFDEDDQSKSKGQIQVMTNAYIPVGDSRDEHRSPLRVAGGGTEPVES